MTMIEKVARAICLEAGIDPGIIICRMCPQMIKGGGFVIPLDEFIGPAWQQYIREAKAAIAAMREPTDKIKEFRTNNADIFDWNCKCYYCGGHKFAVQAYIDAALKEG